MTLKTAGHIWKESGAYGFLPAVITSLLILLSVLPDTGSIEARTDFFILFGMLSFFFTLTAVGTIFSEKLKNVYYRNIPFTSVLLAVLFLYETVTISSASAYFPPLSRVVSLLYEDRDIILRSIFHSLILLGTGYSLGASAGFITGVAASSNRFFGYWLMPFVKIIGPIPATAWIPVCIILFPNFFSAGVFIIAVSVWFPVTVMTSSGIMNVHPSLFDAGRVLGASPFRRALFIAVPAALPTIFTGLFMGMGSSFLTLIAAEMTGVKAGLGFYIVWARDYADYGRIFASLTISAIIFFTIMTTLFKIRDRVLSWQKELIKW